MAQPKIAVFATMFNEEAMLPHFLRHYLSFADKILLLDNDSTDESVAIGRYFSKVEVRIFKTEGFDEVAVLDQVVRAQSELAGFDWIIFPDIDEFVISQPMRRESQILSATKADVLVCRGYCMMEKPNERPLDLEVPISRSRGGYYQSKTYSKPIIIRGGAKIHFGPGKHALIPGKGVVLDGNAPFCLIHAEMIDFALWRYRKNRRALSANNIKNGWSIEYFNKNEEQHRAIWNRHRTIPLQDVPFADWGEQYKVNLEV